MSYLTEISAINLNRLKLKYEYLDRFTDAI